MKIALILSLLGQLVAATAAWSQFPWWSLQAPAACYGSPVVVRQAQAQAEGETTGPVDGPAPTRPGRVVYLTFDDGPNDVWTPQVLDILGQYRVRATFMVTGGNAVRHPELLRRMLEEGHGVGNHSYSHRYQDYQSTVAFARDLELAEEAILLATGRMTHIYRPPGGPLRLTPPCRQVLEAHGYRVVGWNVSGADSCTYAVSAAQISANVLQGVRRLPAGQPATVLLHDGTQPSSREPAPGSAGAVYAHNRQQVVEALPSIIEGLQRSGCRFEVLPEPVLAGDAAAPTTLQQPVQSPPAPAAQGPRAIATTR
ncbi:MAG: polysaccharide deacetylase family protein [Syntrophomonadaceae bacterium]|nr:polysaccharide deacetylase family protein [Syntrophomonadaceae bacterium]MDH7498317.1 polysaccharide deacetylase family protein [Syntrophomonadaceae bacterium]